MSDVVVSASTLAEEDAVIVGRFGAVHGVKGWLKVYSFTEPFDNIATYTSWFGYINKKWQPLAIEDMRIADNHLLVLLENIDDREIARSLTNINIAISREQLAVLADDEYYWADLEGLTVFNQHGEELGQIYMLMETGSNDVFIIRKEGGAECAVPYLDHVVKSIDLDKRCMHVEWDTDF